MSRGTGRRHAETVTGAPPEAPRAWLRWLPPLLALPFLALLAFGLSRDARTIASPLPGRPAPPFALETLDGDTLRLAELRGRAVVLNFWASWCIPCQEEHPVLARVAETWGPEEAIVAGILYQDSPENGRRFMRRFGGEWPSGVDPASRVAIEYGVYGVPETFFIGRDGRVARKQIGPVTWEIVKSTVDSLVAAPPEPVREAPLEAPLESAPAEETGR